MLIQRLEAGTDTTIADDIQAQIHLLPFPASPIVLAKQEELDTLGTELWNLTTRLGRDEAGTNKPPSDAAARKSRALPFLRAFAFLLLDSAGGQGNKGGQCKNCIRLIKVALKAARVCIRDNELGIATKVLERAADYQHVLSQEGEDNRREERELADGLSAQYFAVRTTLVSLKATSKAVFVTGSRTYNNAGMAPRSHGHSGAHVHQMQATPNSTHACNIRGTCRFTV